MLYTILLVILIIFLLGGGLPLSGAQSLHYWGTGQWGGGLGFILLVIVIILLVRGG